MSKIVLLPTWQLFGLLGGLPILTVVLAELLLPIDHVHADQMNHWIRFFCFLPFQAVLIWWLYALNTALGVAVKEKQIQVSKDFVPIALMVFSLMIVGQLPVIDLLGPAVIGIVVPVMLFSAFYSFYHITRKLRILEGKPVDFGSIANRDMILMAVPSISIFLFQPRIKRVLQKQAA